jgi:omega-amidase
MPPVRIAIIQTGNGPEATPERVLQVESLLGGLPVDVSLVILPELWSVPQIDETLPEKSRFSPSILERLADAACRKFCAIHCGSLPWAEQGQLYNRSFFLSEEGNVVAQYDQTHLLRSLKADSPFQAGKAASPFLWKGTVWGNAIGWDILYPEFIRSLALAGSRILLICASWPEGRIPQWRALLQARSMENQAFTLACNRCGHSMGIAPDGTVLAEAGEGEETLVFDIDPAAAEQARKNHPLLEGRRRDLYSLLSSMG